MYVSADGFASPTVECSPEFLATSSHVRFRPDGLIECYGVPYRLDRLRMVGPRTEAEGTGAVLVLVRVEF